MTKLAKFGIMGGAGALGGAIARKLLTDGVIAPDELWISSRSGSRSGFESWRDAVHFTTDNQELVDYCETILIAVPPKVSRTLEFMAKGRLVLSVMAGVSITRLQELSRNERVVRAMSNPAADIGLAYSPWCASRSITAEDRNTVRTVFGSCGLTDEVADEEQIDRFTALTGPVPGFVALYAECMVEYAIRHGIDPEVAVRAIRQLFLASAETMASSAATPAEQVEEMIEYAGTTAAGLEMMRHASLYESIERGLDAACEKAARIATED
jgi:pyrroline-5-carboxylate reductase